MPRKRKRQPVDYTTPVRKHRKPSSPKPKPKSRKSLTASGLNRNTKTYKSYMKERRRVQNLAQKRKSTYGEEIDINSLFGNIPSTYTEMRRATREMRKYHTGQSLSNLQSSQDRTRFSEAIEHAQAIRERANRQPEPPVSEHTPAPAQPPQPLPTPPPPSDIPSFADVALENMRDMIGQHGTGTDLPLDESMQDYYNVGTVGGLVNLALDTLISQVGRDAVAGAYQQQLEREREYMERWESRYDQYFNINFLNGMIDFISRNGEGIDMSAISKMLSDAELVIDENVTASMEEAAEMERETFFHFN